MTEFLVPETHKAGGSYFDPYTKEGAKRLIVRHRDDVIDMLDEMEANRKKWDGGKTMLSQSCLRSKVYIAAAMKTMGWIEERSTATGACGLILTDKAIAQMTALKRVA